MTSLPDAMAAYARQTALEQRARLLDAVWEDVQGQRRGVQAGALPAQFLPSIEPGRAKIERYAADLIYCPDGVGRVARDHVGQHPGAGLLEAPVLAAFLPCLCRLLLGETLQLPSLPVWWLGEPGIWPVLAADSRRFVIRDGLDPDAEPILLANMPADRRRWLQTVVDAEPTRFVAGLTLSWRAPIEHVTYDTGHAAMGMYC